MKKTIISFCAVLLLGLVLLSSTAFAAEKLPLVKDIPEDMLRYAESSLAVLQEAEERGLGIKYDEALTSVGGGYPAYVVNGEVSAEELLELDGKDVRDLLKQFGHMSDARIFIAYTASGEPKTAFMVGFNTNTGKYTQISVGIDPIPIIDGVNALLAANPGEREIIVGASGSNVFDITDEMQYMVKQNIDEYYNTVLPAYNYIGYMQQLELARMEATENVELGASGGSAELPFGEYAPLSGIPVYSEGTDAPSLLPYIACAAVILCGGVFLSLCAVKKRTV